MVDRLFLFQAEDGIRDLVRSRGLGDVYKRQIKGQVEIVEPLGSEKYLYLSVERDGLKESLSARVLSLIHI